MKIGFKGFSDDGGSLTSKVFKNLEEKILEGSLAPGESLTENRLSEEYGVSRTPVREALFQLELEGLVRITPNKGAVVVGISEQDIEDIYTIRMSIEGLASRWAAQRITKEELNRLSEIVDLQRFYVERGDITQCWYLDGAFHSVIYDASRSNPLRNTLKGFHNYIRRAREASFHVGDRARIANEEHAMILEAIKNGNGEDAERLTSEHIALAKANLLRTIKEDGTPAFVKK